MDFNLKTNTNMKRQISIFAILLFCCYSKIHAQNNLVYSRVITNITTSGSSTYDTVPAGKVWKMESIMHSNFYNNTTAADAYLEINSVSFPLLPNIYLVSTPTSNRGNITPLWLKAGDIIRVYSNTGAKVFYSIIEYKEN